MPRSWRSSMPCFLELGIGDFQVQLNNRKVLRGFLESQGVRDGELQLAVLREVDKLDKRGVLDVRDTLIGQGFGIPAAQVEKYPDFCCHPFHQPCRCIGPSGCADPRLRARGTRHAAPRR